MSTSTFKFNDYTEEVEGMLADLAHGVLEECAGELESQVKRNTAVRTGQTKNSWTHSVKSSKDLHVATVGSPIMNAVWEEFGTGEYALNGDGRKGGWFYVDDEGNGHFTHGKQARRPFWKAYTYLKPRLIKRVQDALKGGLSK